MLILTQISSLEGFQELTTPGHLCEFVTQPLEPLVIQARSQGDYFFRVEVSYRYCMQDTISQGTWSALRSAGNFSEKEHFRWRAGRKKLLGRAGRRAPSKFSINVPGARYVRWQSAGSYGLTCDVSPDEIGDDRSILRLVLKVGAPGRRETADSYKLERPFVDLEKLSEVLQPFPSWYFFQQSHLRK